jgi:hypothetical protein
MFFLPEFRSSALGDISTLEWYSKGNLLRSIEIDVVLPVNVQKKSNWPLNNLVHDKFTKRPNTH